MKKNWNSYKGKVSKLFTVIVALMGAHGIFSYYYPKIDRLWQLLSVTIFSTIKMFFFVPGLPAEADVTITYEIAKWVAPILTSALVLTRASNTILHWKNRTVNKFTKKHIVIFGRNEISNSLIFNLINDKSKFKISLVSGEQISDDIKQQYERKGVAVYNFDFDYSTSQDIDYLFENLKLNNVNSILFMGEDDLKNYSFYVKLIRKLSPNHLIKIYINCKTKSVIQYIEDVNKQEKIENPDIENIEVITFNKEELIVRLLLQNPNSQNGALSKNLSSLEKQVRTDSDIDLSIIEEGLSQNHILVFGINDLIKPFFRNVANDLTISIRKKTKITVIYENENSFIEKYKTDNEEILGALEIEGVQTSFSSRILLRFLRKLKEENDITSIFLFLEDTVVNLKILKLLEKVFDVPVALRNSSGLDLNTLLPVNYKKLKIFGNLNEVMTENIFLRTKLDKRAVDFNKSYNRATSSAGLGEGERWQSLSNVKKASSRASASHSVIKEEILRRIYFNRKDFEIRQIIKDKFEEYLDIEKIRNDDPDRFKRELKEFLIKNPILDYLSRLEHIRWCNSYYAMNFKYGKEKDEENRTHYCLIDEWEDIMGKEFFRCHPEYDLISVFALFSEEFNEN